MSDWSTQKSKKKKNKYTPPDWSKSVQSTVDSMSTSDFFQQVLEVLDSKIDNCKMVILGLGQSWVIFYYSSFRKIVCDIKRFSTEGSNFQKVGSNNL